MKKILALLFLITFTTYSQEIMDEAELTAFLNTNNDGKEINVVKEFLDVKYKTKDLFSEKITENLFSFDLSKIINYRTKENGDTISLEFIFRNKESIKKTGFKLFTLSFKKEEKIKIEKTIATLKSYQKKFRQI